MMSEGPVSEKQRYLILDALRGFALMGIALANFPEFALWTFLSPEDQAAMGTFVKDSFTSLKEPFRKLKVTSTTPKVHFANQV